MRLAPLSLAIALAPALALAQAPRAPAAPPAPAGAPAALPATLPTPPTVDDAMLAPPPAPSKLVVSWGDALGIVRTRSTDLRIALDEVQRAEAVSREALAGILPTLSATGNVTRNMIRGDVLSGFDAATLRPTYATQPDAWTYGGNLTLTQPVLALRAWHSIDTAKKNEDVARLSVEDQKRLIVIGVANAIVAVVTAERVAELNRIGLRAALERLDLAKRRAALGAANALDVVRADQDVSVARAALVTGDESLRQAREGLGLALGFAEPWGVTSDINLDALESSARAACTAAPSVDERADIQAARGSLEVASRNVDDVWLQFTPTVNLVSVLSGSSLQYVNGKQETWTIAGVLSVPIWDGGYKYGALKDTRAQVDEAGQRLEAARRGATIQIEQARRGVRVADDSRAVAERARDLAKETERLSRVAFQAGTATSLDLIDSGRRLREAETQLALKEFDLVRSRIGALLALARCPW